MRTFKALLSVVIFFISLTTATAANTSSGYVAPAPAPAPVVAFNCFSSPCPDLNTDQGSAGSQGTPGTSGATCLCVKSPCACTDTVQCPRTWKMINGQCQSPTIVCDPKNPTALCQVGTQPIVCPKGYTLEGTGRCVPIGIKPPTCPYGGILDADGKCTICKVTKGTGEYSILGCASKPPVISPLPMPPCPPNKIYSWLEGNCVPNPGPGVPPPTICRLNQKPTFNGTCVACEQQTLKDGTIGTICAESIPQQITLKVTDEPFPDEWILDRPCSNGIIREGDDGVKVCEYQPCDPDSFQYPDGRGGCVSRCAMTLSSEDAVDCAQAKEECKTCDATPNNRCVYKGTSGDGTSCPPVSPRPPCPVGMCGLYRSEV